MPLVDYITREKRFFESENIELVPGLRFNQYVKVRRDFNYYLSNFESGDIDSQGYKKYFRNIVRNPKNITQKEISFEPKDILFNTTGSGNSKKTWLLERDFKHWAKTIGLAKHMARIFSDIAWFGSAVIKTVGKDIHPVDLRNFYVQPDADTLDDADWMIEIHPYSLVGFEVAAKEMGWSSWGTALEEATLADFNEIVVFERYGLIRKSELAIANGNEFPSTAEDDYIYARVVISDINVKSATRRSLDIMPNEGLVLDARAMPHPYHEFHGEKIPGRWIGVSVVELLRDVQMRINEMTNLKVKSSYLSAMQMFQTRDESLESNMLVDHEFGDIMLVDDPIERVLTEDRNLGSFQLEEGVWMSNRDEVTLSRDILRGERLPAGTPLGSAELVAGMARGYFDTIKRGVADSMKSYIFRVIIPKFEETSNTEHILRLVGEDLSHYREMFVEVDVRKKLFAHIQRTSNIPDSIEMDVFRAISEEEMSRESELPLPLPEGFYKDGVEYDLDIIITGQYEDSRIKAANLQMALSFLMQRPDMLQNPILRKVFSKILESGGVRIEDIEGDLARQGLNDRMGDLPLGGGMGTPEAGGSPVPEETELQI